MKMLVVAPDALDPEELAQQAGCQGYYRGVPPRLAGVVRIGDVIDEGDPEPPPPPTEQELLAIQRREASLARRATLRALRDGSGNLTAAQLTAILRVLVREVLGDD